jgi:hypothetical protein
MTGRWAFLWARLIRNEPALAQFSAAQSAIMADLAGKRIAVIGNARSLSQHGFGAEIDRADLVIRLNASPIPATASHGHRTDWIAASTPIAQETLSTRAPRRVLWMTRKRKRLPWALTQRPGFYLNRRADVMDLRDRLGGPPTTGLMVIDLLARSEMQETRLYGFDFFASLSLSGGRTAAQVPHDFGAERAFVQALMGRDTRFVMRP